MLRLIFLLCCSLIAAVYSHDCGVEVNRVTSDPRWRLVSGLDVSSIYTLFSQIREVVQPPLVNTSATDNTDRLESVIDGVCNLVSFYELVSRAKPGSQLHTILTATVEDSCHWLHYLVSSHPDVSISDEFSELPPSCTAADTTRLHLHCLQRKIRSELRLLVHRSLADSLHSYYKGTLPATRASDWIRSSPFSTELQSRLLDII